MYFSRVRMGFVPKSKSNKRKRGKKKRVVVL